MTSWMRSRLDPEEGFTLIELMVVVLIIAILIAIAIPTYVGARLRAQDAAAQSVLRNGLTAAKVYYVDNEEYGTSSTDAAFETDLELIAPSLDFEPMASATQGVIGFVRGGQQVVFATQSGSNTWFCIADEASTGTTYDSDAALANVDTVAECDQASW
jgi:type IV pilus assembly protein PilA